MTIGTCVYRESRKCRALMRYECPDNCPFHCTANERKAKQDKAHERINTLPIDKQEYISNKYYGEQMPWKDKEEK
mgnify:CR=1 FL=1|jgi:hypothetical protein